MESIGVNNLDKFREGDAPQALNFLVCNPDGYVIGDAILFQMEPDRYLSAGAPWTHNWIEYNAERRDDAVDVELLYDPFEDEEPPDFRFQIQGPQAIDVMDEVVDDGMPNLSFFQMDLLEIDGKEFNALSHGMAGSPGVELFGDYSHHDEVLERILQVGKEHDIRQIGSKAYKTGKIGSGWFNASVPAIYTHPELKEYREWLPMDSTEGKLSIGGSFVSGNINDYYMTPMERGQGNLISFDHDYIGRSALEEMIKDQRRKRVTLKWNPEDVIEVYESMFHEGPTKKFIPLPDTAHQWSVAHYDVIKKNGEEVGFSKYPGYLYYDRNMLSLATIDVEHSEPGTQVSFIWGEQTEKSRVESHEQTEIRATVAESPYIRGGRR